METFEAKDVERPLGLAELPFVRGLDFRIVPGHFWAAALASGSVSEVRTNKFDGLISMINQ